MSDLLSAITPDPAPRDWPRTPRALQARIAKLAKPLRTAKVEIAATGRYDPVTRRALWRVEGVGAESFDPSEPSDTAADLPGRAEGSPEGSNGRRRDPSEILRENQASDLGKEGTKDLKDSAGIPSLTACARHSRTGFGLHPHCRDCQGASQ
jgi:hypothetical protein